MAEFDLKDLLISLFFPAAVFLWGSVRLVTDLMFAGGAAVFAGLNIIFLFPYVAAMLGGVISALLTIRMRVDTSGYFTKRLIVVGIICAIHRVFLSLITVPMLIVTIAAAAGVVYQAIRVQDNETTRGERAVLMLSDPLIYWSIYWTAVQLLYDV